MLRAQLRSFWRSIFRRSEIEQEMSSELQFHLDARANHLMQLDGLSHVEAVRRARLEFGSVEKTREEARASLGLTWVDELRIDARYALRALRRTPVFSVSAILTLALGIGANTTIFTVANALLFRAPAGVSEPDRLVDVFRTQEGQSFADFTSSYPYYLDVRRRVTTLTGLYAFEFEPQPVTLAAEDGVELAFANCVTLNYFSELGVAPAAGRLFASHDDEDATLVVISYRHWQRRFNGNPTVVGQTVHINRQPFVVVGVAPEGFQGTNVVAPDLWIPIGTVGIARPGSGRLTTRMSGLGMGGRLAPGVTLARAEAELDTIARGIEREHPIEERGRRLHVARLSFVPRGIANVAAGFFALLLALVSVVLVIACANLAGVLLARAAARSREIAVRVALGAGRARLVRQLITETTLLFALGAGAGLLLARWLTSLLLSILPAFPVPVDVALPLDTRVLLFTAVVSLVAALLSGLAPAWHAAKVNPVVDLKDGSQGPSERLRVRSVFVIAQVAFSILLVVVGSLLTQALRRTGKVDLGFDARNVETASLDLATAGYTTVRSSSFARELVDRLRQLPVDAATLARYLPGRGGADVDLTVPGVPPPPGLPFFTATWNAVDPEFFTTLRIPIVAGRDFNAADQEGSQPVAIVGEAAARQFWPGQDAIGKYLQWHEGRRNQPGTVTTVQVVGVVRDLRSPEVTARGPAPQRRVEYRSDGRQLTVADPASLMIYVPLAQRPSTRLTLLVRGTGRPLAGDIRRLVNSIDPNLPLILPERLDAQRGPVYVQLQVAAAVAGSVGLVGLLLAAIGIYGVTSYNTARRTREMGIRIALGAKHTDTVRMVMRQGMSLVLSGALIGLIVAAVGTRLFEGLLFGVPPNDPVTFGGAALLFAVVGFAACYVPARRAARVDPMVALRCE